MSAYRLRRRYFSSLGNFVMKDQQLESEIRADIKWGYFDVGEYYLVKILGLTWKRLTPGQDTLEHVWPPYTKKRKQLFDVARVKSSRAGSIKSLLICGRGDEVFSREVIVLYVCMEIVIDPARFDQQRRVNVILDSVNCFSGSEKRFLAF